MKLNYLNRPFRQQSFLLENFWKLWKTVTHEMERNRGKLY